MSSYTTLVGSKSAALGVRFGAGAVRLLACFGLACIAAGLSACGSSSPTPPRQMIGSPVGAASGAGYGQWNSQISYARRPGRGSKRRPKGGGYYKVGTPYQVAGKWYYPSVQSGYDETGKASWYGSDFDGKATANGETYDMRGLSAAHKTLPMPSYVYVTNLKNNRTIMVRVNDRGPFKPGRIIDLSSRAARELGFHHHGIAQVRVQYAGRAPLGGDDRRERAYLAKQSWHRRASR